MIAFSAVFADIFRFCTAFVRNMISFEIAFWMLWTTISYKSLKIMIAFSAIYTPIFTVFRSFKQFVITSEVSCRMLWTRVFNQSRWITFGPPAILTEKLRHFCSLYESANCLAGHRCGFIWRVDDYIAMFGARKRARRTSLVHRRYLQTTEKPKRPVPKSEGAWRCLVAVFPEKIASFSMDGNYECQGLSGAWSLEQCFVF